MSDFQRALAFVLEHEGGYIDDAADPGGRTDRGISARAHPEAWADGIVTDEEVERIYYDRYWLPAGCDALPWPLSLAVFDFAVHSGVTRALGYCGQRSTDAPVISALRLTGARATFLRRLAHDRPASAKFLRGWLRRCADLARVCITESKED